MKNFFGKHFLAHHECKSYQFYINHFSSFHCTTFKSKKGSKMSFNFSTDQLKISWMVKEVKIVRQMIDLENGKWNNYFFIHLMIDLLFTLVDDPILRMNIKSLNKYQLWYWTKKSLKTKPIINISLFNFNHLMIDLLDQLELITMKCFHFLHLKRLNTWAIWWVIEKSEWMRMWIWMSFQFVQNAHISLHMSD